MTARIYSTHNDQVATYSEAIIEHVMEARERGDNRDPAPGILFELIDMLINKGLLNAEDVNKVLPFGFIAFEEEETTQTPEEK